ncbi:hypothetical protein FBULB1_10273 [Fusarium bulbicola]|nr:hypothetical protein FBULB1_10273 [Fusarium bulbicola]
MPQLFEPKPGQEMRFEFDNTPTYLFRLHVPQSAGSTDITYVDSPAYPHDMNKTHERGSACGQDLLQLPPAEAATRLEAHLRWKCQYIEESPCNLMSWSSSLLFLLHYGFHRRKKHYDPKPKLSEIRLIMIDTRDYPQQTFLRDLDALNHYHGYNQDLEKVKGWRDTKYYFGEYLTQGHLDIRGKCVQMTMHQLIGGGLFTVICPGLNEPNNNWVEWAKPVCELRVGIGKSHVADQKQIRSAIFVAKDCVGDRFLVPFALMLLGLRSQRKDDEKIANAFRAMFTNEELNLGEIKYDVEAKRVLDGGTSVMEELKRFQELMEMINTSSNDAAEKERHEGDIATISDSFVRLSTNQSPNVVFSSRRRRIVKKP